MRESRTGLSVSILLHAALLLPLLALPARYYEPAKTFFLDFSLVSGENREQGGSYRAGGEQARVASSRPANREPSAGTAPAKAVVPPGETARAESPRHDPLGETRAAALSEEEGPVTVRGSLNPVAAGAAVSSGTGGSAGGSGSGKGAAGGMGTVLDYGNGGGRLTEFAFIREAILKSVRYPEKARRMGWEGRVVLAFTVIENGSIRDIRIVSSSGIPLLDDDAREALRRTRFSRSIPSRLVVTLPVEYRLER